jgi:hypothetical protein
VSRTPYVGFSNVTLAKLPGLTAGQLIDCPQCKGKHPACASDPPTALWYVCGGQMHLAGVAGKNVVGVKPDTSSESEGPHALCDSCWERRCMVRGEPGRVPVTVRMPRSVPCCVCGGMTRAGIWVVDVDGVQCGGQSSAHDESSF